MPNSSPLKVETGSVLRTRRKIPFHWEARSDHELFLHELFIKNSVVVSFCFILSKRQNCHWWSPLLSYESVASDLHLRMTNKTSAKLDISSNQYQCYLSGIWLLRNISAVLINSAVVSWEGSTMKTCRRKGTSEMTLIKMSLG